MTGCCCASRVCKLWWAARLRDETSGEMGNVAQGSNCQVSCTTCEMRRRGCLLRLVIRPDPPTLTTY